MHKISPFPKFYLNWCRITDVVTISISAFSHGAWCMVLILDAKWEGKKTNENLKVFRFGCLPHKSYVRCLWNRLRNRNPAPIQVKFWEWTTLMGPYQQAKRWNSTSWTLIDSDSTLLPRTLHRRKEKRSEYSLTRLGFHLRKRCII